MKVYYYKLKLVRIAFQDDPMFPGTKIPLRVEEGPYLQSGKDDVLVKGYAKAITRAGELNDAIKKEGNWDKGWRFVVVQVTREEQQNLFDVGSADGSS